MLPLLPPKTHIDFTRQMYGRGRGRRQDWPDDPMYQREVTSKEIRPDPVWMAMRATFITTRSLFSRINFLRRLAGFFSLETPTRNTPMTRSTAGDAHPCDSC